MKKIASVVLVAATMLAANAFAKDTVNVGGQAMLPTKDIVDNAVNSADHTTLGAAVKAAGLVDTLKGKGPFTVFAPTNAAFAKLPAGTVDTLLKPENKATLTKALSGYTTQLGLTEVTRTPNRVTALLGDVEAAKIGPELVHADVPVLGFTVQSPSLEDVFVSLTGEGFDVSG